MTRKILLCSKEAPAIGSWAETSVGKGYVTVAHASNVKSFDGCVAWCVHLRNPTFWEWLRYWITGRR